MAQRRLAGLHCIERSRLGTCLRTDSEAMRGGSLTTETRRCHPRRDGCRITDGTFASPRAVLGPARAILAASGYHLPGPWWRIAGIFVRSPVRDSRSEPRAVQPRRFVREEETCHEKRHRSLWAFSSAVEGGRVR